MAKSPMPMSTSLIARKLFIERTMIPLIQRLPRLRIVLEHITTANAVKFVLGAPDNVAATITAHHLLLNRNDMFAGRNSSPSLLPADSETRRTSAGTGQGSYLGQSEILPGTDSAPHARDTKEAACGCAGIYTAHAGIELYAEAFDAPRAWTNWRDLPAFWRRFLRSCAK